MIRRFFPGTSRQPQSPGGGLNMLDYSPAVWLDAQDASTVNLVDNKVSVWNDKANGNDAHQLDASIRPLYGTNAVSNGLPSIEIQDLNGVGLELTSSIAISEIIMVTSYRTGIEISSSPVYPTIISGSGSNGAPRIMIYHNTDSLYGSNVLTDIVYKNGSESGTNVMLPLPFTVCNFRFTQSTSLYSLLKNSSFSDRNFRGFTGEIILFTNDVPATDRTDIINHLMTKWGI